jgi:hypothetical protein
MLQKKTHAKILLINHHEFFALVIEFRYPDLNEPTSVFSFIKAYESNFRILEYA